MNERPNHGHEPAGSEGGAPVKRGRLRWLRRSAAVAWLAWLASAAVVWWIYRRHVMHPHFLLLGPLVALQIAAPLWSLGIGVRCLFRGPRRLRACAWMGLAMVPMLLCAALVGYGYLVSLVWRRDVSGESLSLKLLCAGGVSLLDGAARISHPNRLAGEKVVMIYHTASHPQEDVEAMDRHIRRLEEVLGRECRTKVHWVRGTLWGIEPCAIQGVAIGSPGDVETNAGELTRLDQHEVAHVVINHLAGPDADPPAVLAEGWAEAQEGQEPGDPARRAIERRNGGPVLSLADFLHPDWYGMSRGPAYVQGGALVDFILREYGGETFFELYRTCRRETFAEDCRRLLGVSLEKLDRLYWADARQRVAELEKDEKGQRCVKLLLPLPATGRGPDEMVAVWMDRAAAEKAEPPADAAARQAFLAEYPGALRRLMRAYDPVSISAGVTSVRRDEEGKQTRETCRIEYACNGRRRRYLVEDGESSQVIVAAPEQSFHLSRNAGDRFWSIEDASTRYLGDYHDRSRAVGLWLRPFSFMGESIADRMANPEFLIRDIAATEQAGRSLVKIVYEEEEGRTQGSFIVDPQRGWALSELEYRFEPSEFPTIRCTHRFTYNEAEDYPPVVKTAIQHTQQDERRATFTQRIEVEGVRFGPVPERDFRLDGYPVKRPLGTWLVGGTAAVGVLLIAAASYCVLRRRRAPGCLDA